jgi:hypothetical protein
VHFAENRRVERFAAPLHCRIGSNVFAGTFVAQLVTGTSEHLLSKTADALVGEHHLAVMVSPRPLDVQFL